MSLVKFKDPDATLDYMFDWSDWLQEGDVLVEHDVIVPSGLTKASSAIDPGEMSVTVWLSGGTVGNVYSVTCRITTQGGRVDDRTMRLTVKER